MKSTRNYWGKPNMTGLILGCSVATLCAAWSGHRPVVPAAEFGTDGSLQDTSQSPRKSVADTRSEKQIQQNHRPAGNALAGIDVLQRNGFRQLRGRRVGLITNHTGVNRDGTLTARLLHEAPEVQLVALFSPEHGIAGNLEQANIDDTRDAETGLPVHSLYGNTRRPTAESLQGVDTLVFDIQDIGTRFYTYISTMGNAMRTAAKHSISFVVLDRPNPIGGDIVAGPVLDAGRESFVGYHTIPVRHGMTIGELARMFNDELKLHVPLDVIRAEGWQRDELWDATGLMWRNPSPNMRSLTQAILYPGIGLLETTNLSVGRGTDTPFEVIGAPWIKGRQLAAALNDVGQPGVRFVPIEFTPKASKFKGERCEGVNIIVVERAAFRPVRTGLEIARQLRKNFPNDWHIDNFDRLLGSRSVLDAVSAVQNVEAIEASYEPDLDEFIRRRAKYLLY